MPDDLSDAGGERALRQAIARRAEWRELVSRRQDVDDQLLRARTTAARWRRQAARSAERLERILGGGLFGWYRRLRSSQDERDQHEHDLAEARRSHDRVDAEIERLEQQAADLQEQLRSYADAESHYQILLADREERLRQVDPGLAERLDRSAARIGELAELLAAIGRTVEDGRNAEVSLSSAQMLLGRARQFGRFDIVGAIGAGFPKHAAFREAKVHIDSARRHLDRMQSGMRSQANRLQGIAVGADLEIFDLVFDNVIVDLLVQGRIREASERVRETLEGVRQAIWSAERYHQQIAAQVRSARDERERFVEQAG